MDKQTPFYKKINSYKIEDIKNFLEDFFRHNPQLQNKFSRKRILLKPNLLWYSPPENAITTHPQVIKATAEIFLDLKAKIYMGDSPGWGDGKKILSKLGLKEFIEKNNIEVLDSEKNKIFKIPDGKILKSARLFSQLEEIDYIINLPKVKTHMMTGVSLCVKNMFGLLIGKEKVAMHFKYPRLADFYRMLFDLYNFLKPALNIVDGIISLEGQGPGKKGIPKTTGYLFADADAIKMDLFLIKWMGDKKALYFYLLNYPEYKFFYNNISVPAIKYPFRLPFREKKILELIGIPEKYILPLREKLLPYPQTENDKCILCKRCIENCPQGVISLKNNHIYYNYSKCIKCYCCQEICPAGAIYLKRNLWQKIWNRLL